MKGPFPLISHDRPDTPAEMAWMVQNLRVPFIPLTFKSQSEPAPSRQKCACLHPGHTPGLFSFPESKEPEHPGPHLQLWIEDEHFLFQEGNTTPG